MKLYAVFYEIWRKELNTSLDTNSIYVLADSEEEAKEMVINNIEYTDDYYKTICEIKEGRADWYNMKFGHGELANPEGQKDWKIDHKPVCLSFDKSIPFEIAKEIQEERELELSKYHAPSEEDIDLLRRRQKSFFDRLTQMLDNKS